MRGVPLPFASALLLASALPVAAAVVPGPGECVPTIELVEPALLSGPWHTLQPCAHFVGHMARFELDSPFGSQTVDSLELLALRIEEMPAVAALEQTNAALLAMRAAGSATYDRGSSVASVIAHPVQTVKGLPQGVLRYFQQRYDKYAGRARKYGGRARDEMTNADEAYDSPSTRPGVGHIDGPKNHKSAGEKLGREAQKHALDYVSYKSTRRKWARKLGIDPYTTNPLIRVRLDRLAWYAVAGEQAVDLAFGTLPGGVLDALGTAKQLREYALDAPPEQTRKINAGRLLDLGCSPVETHRFLERGRFSPVLQTSLVDALEATSPVSGCNDVIELATAVRGEVEARYLVNAMRLLATEAGSQPKLELVGTSVVLRDSVATIAGNPSRETWDGRTLSHTHRSAGPTNTLMLPLAVDRLEWTPSTRAFFDAEPLRLADKTALVSGELSPRARRELTRRGWHIRESLRNAEPVAIANDD